MPSRRFPPRLGQSKTNPACFVVREQATGAKLLTCDEARRIAANFAKLSDLLRVLTPGAAPVPPILKTLQGNRKVAKIHGLSVCGSRCSHTSSRCKNNSLLQSAKEIAQCTRINAIALAFLISTEGGCVAVILPLVLLGDRHAEGLGIRKGSRRVS
jgi:hypothetical protein